MEPALNSDSVLEMTTGESMRLIQDIENLEGKRVLVRVDYNVPLNNGKVENDERIIASIETINFLKEHGAIVVLTSHLGRPEGKTDSKFSLRPTVKVLENLIKSSVQFVPDCVGEKRDKAVMSAKNGEVVLLENVRFHPEDKANDPSFAQRLTRGCDIFVNDAFSASHRAHASVVGVAGILPAYAGFTLQREVSNLGKVLENPEKPFVFISGGAKVSDKIGILKNLLSKVDVILIGGGMANTFLASQRVEIGCSLCEDDFIREAGEIIITAQSRGVRVMLPRDVVVTKAITDNAKGLEIPIEEIGELDIIVDIGEQTVAEFEREIAKAGTIFWNGPLGIAEYPNFAKATLAVGKAVARAKAYSVIGGGDTVGVIPEEYKKEYNFVSMAGGASMEFLEGKALPGIEVLEDKP